VWASGPVWTGAENLTPPEFYPRTVQPVGSRYTDYATRPHYREHLKILNVAIGLIYQACCNRPDISGLLQYI